MIFSVLIKLLQAGQKKLPATNRPKPLIEWLKDNHTVTDRPSVNAENLPVAWRAWWVSLMPPWRALLIGDWPLGRAVPNGEEWKTVRKGGPNGIFLTLLVLHWWRSSTSSQREYKSALEDVAWVMKQLVEGITPFFERNRPVRSPVTSIAPDTAPRRVSGRVSRPSARKLGESGASPGPATALVKRTAAAADLNSPKRSRRPRASNA